MAHLDIKIDTRPGCYYVSALDGPRSWLIAGPWPTHREALDAVKAVKSKAERLDDRSQWMAWGTARTEIEDIRPTPLGVAIR